MPSLLIHLAEVRHDQKELVSLNPPGYPPFPMNMPEDHDHAGALAFVQAIWPNATVE
ncbi:hypothetical protein PS723_04304 [Pseudomonas fluorescens]|uniref:Uncharacterized protein n=1 Tax=Pseudomonas fluorescens TaxID=294 RepID=A0A5E7E687_PSEFL|nr:hypothetical protein PS723_04304 [Pseudomonas fluorescens]